MVENPQLKFLKLAEEITLDQYRDELDKADVPRVNHLINVQARVRQEYPGDIELQIIARLHDVVEDGKFTIEDLAQLGFSNRVLAAVDALTQDSTKSYLSHYIFGQVMGNIDAIKVKILDIYENLHRPKDPKRSKKLKYRIALPLLYAALAAHQAKEVRVDIKSAVTGKDSKEVKLS